ncbi:MAG: hypothetical protein WD052_00145 [Bacteroidales bacterium]
MEKSNKHLEDLSEIRNLMERSTRFLSLSGWSGISAGIFAILGAIAAYLYLEGGNIYYDESLRILSGEKNIPPRVFLLGDAVIVLMLALISAVYFSWKKAKTLGEKIWSPVIKRLLFHITVPLAAGGLLSLILIWQNHVNLVAPLTLIFYGTALLNAGKYTNREVIWLGMAEIITGLAAAFWQEFGLYFWALGFGLYHIIYGVTLYYKYDRKVNRDE